MGPLFLANWRVIHQRFCLLIWLVAIALVVLILAHLVAASAACAKPGALRGSVCAPHLVGSQPVNR
jgi:hypothetical protein